MPPENIARCCAMQFKQRTRNLCLIQSPYCKAGITKDTVAEVVKDVEKEESRVNTHAADHQ
jgi:hypothetical protein